jgi:hypothetical protein
MADVYLGIAIADANTLIVIAVASHSLPYERLTQLVASF